MGMPFTGERYVPELRGRIYYEHLHRYMLAREMARDKDVLDIASGEGYGAAYLALVASSVIGVDVDPQSVRHAAARYTAMNLSFRVGTCTQIPLADETVDLVVCFETIEHIAEHDLFLAEIRRVLRPDGRLVISSPNKAVYSDRDAYENPYHVRELYFDELRDLLCASFPSVRVHGQRLVAASAIHPLRGSSRDARYLSPGADTAQSGLPALPEPTYFVAVCSRLRESDGLPLDSLFIDPRDDLLAQLGPLPAAVDRFAGGQLTLSRLGSALPPASEQPAPLQGGRRHLEEIAEVRPAPDELVRDRDELAARLESSERAIEKVTAELEALRAEHSNANVRIAGLIEASERSAAHHIVELSALEREADLKRAALQRRIDELSAALDEVRHKAAVSEEQHAGRLEDALHAHASIVAERNVLQRDLVAQQTELATAHEALTSITAERDALREELRAQQTVLATVHGSLTSIAAERDMLKGQLGAQQTELASAHDELMRTREDLQRTADLLHEIVTSTSWRLTKPFRLARRVVAAKM